ncbi:MAG TPA: histidine kinase [Polyangia bacterium]|nr:histidine kinase [Polyangia bacterium]
MKRTPPQEPSALAPKLHWRLWACVFAGWTLIGLTFTLNYYLFADHYVAIFKQPPSLREMLIWELPYWLLWALLSPAIFRFTERFPLERGRLLRTAWLHVAACFAFSLAHRATYLLVGWLLHVAVYRQLASLPVLYDFLFLFNLPTGFMCYATILLVSYALAYYRRFQQAQHQTTLAQLEALKMQLQPHFLFNALNSISALVEEDAEAAQEMLARLGDFLRLTLDNSGAQEVPLREELRFLHCYLDIERVRFQDRLTVQMEIEPATLDALVPNLILQPLVENSLRHGIAARVGPGRIEIRASRAEGRLRLEVKDNGPGLHLDGSASSKRGLGFKLTRERLEGLYAEQQRLTLADAPGGGLAVQLEIPFATAGLVASEPTAGVS